MQFFRTCIALLVVSVSLNAGAAPARPVVLELFTAQGCASCPPAEALLTKLAADPSLLALDYHVDYWDYVNWKDPYSLKDSTERQYRYADIFNKRGVFTPQLIVDGQTSVIATREDDVTDAITHARKEMTDIEEISVLPLTLRPASSSLSLHIASGPVPDDALILAVRFRNHTTTHVTAGENKGKTLTSIHTVIAIENLGAATGKPQNFTIDANGSADIGTAILVQDASSGRILGATSYIGK